jgi:NAD(P)-dependent dehydrogenase (short-subunit alcohol dehydrogenase family)
MESGQSRKLAVVTGASSGIGFALAKVFARKSSITEVGAGEKDDPAEVARQGFDALMAGKERVVAGAFKNKAQAAVSGVIPDRRQGRKTPRDGRTRFGEGGLR